MCDQLPGESERFMLQAPPVAIPPLQRVKFSYSYDAPLNENIMVKTCHIWYSQMITQL